MALTPRGFDRPIMFRLEEVKKDYQMGEVTVSALRGITLEVYEGEFLIVLGPSGSGKSTFLNIMGGLDTPTSGSVRFRDELLSSYSPTQLTRYRREHVGFVFQFYNLMPNLTAEENVEMAAEISSNPMPAREALRLVNLEERRTHFPSQLSGGEQQRVAIARAMAKRPTVLLCDEPTGSLDYSTGKVVLDVLVAANEQESATVVLITHNAAVAAIGHRVVRITDGTVRELRVNERRLTAAELEW